MHGDCTHSHTKIGRMLKWAIVRREMWHIAYIIFSADVSPVADIREDFSQPEALWCSSRGGAASGNR